ncbi:MAG: outer membrane protein assembly factor [Fibrobacter sp.]|nr:outer membrane protein assembly factor [Fibrobacter sp.]
MNRILLSLTVLFFAAANAFSAVSDACTDGKKILNVRYSGLKETKPHVVERELLNAPGQIFSVENFHIEKLNLESLDLFSDVSLVCTESADGLDLEYRFTELWHWIPSPAGKKTDQDGWMLGLALAHLNVAGEDVRVEAQYRTSLSPLFDAKEFAIYASSPWLLGLPLSWNFEFLRTDSWDALRNFYDRSWYAHLEIGARLLKNVSLLWAPSYRYVQKYGSVPDLGLGVLLDARDSKVDPHLGAYEEFRVTRYGVFYADVEDYVEYLWDNRLYFPVGRLITGASSLLRYRPGTQMFFDRLHQGGANTLRGFDPDSSIHGRHEAIWNVEERFVLLERRPFSVLGANLFWGVQLVAGVEGSFLWDSTTPDWSDYRQSVYGGIHFIIPALDRIRIEAGYSPDGGKIKASVGLYDKNTSMRWRSR